MIKYKNRFNREIKTFILRSTIICGLSSEKQNALFENILNFIDRINAVYTFVNRLLILSLQFHRS